jgi:hypothetical protein
MADWPSNAHWLMTSFQETAESGVIKSEMERGPAKLRVASSRVAVELTGTVVFLSAKHAADFEDWFYDDLKRVGWFSLRHPRTRDVVTARFKGGELGSLQPVAPAFAASARTVTLEYMR